MPVYPGALAIMKLGPATDSLPPGAVSPPLVIVAAGTPARDRGTPGSGTPGTAAGYPTGAPALQAAGGGSGGWAADGMVTAETLG